MSALSFGPPSFRRRPNSHHSAGAMEAESTEGAAGEKIRELTEEFRATFRPNLLTNNTTPSIPMKDLVEFLVPGDGLLENTRKRSKAKAKKDYHELAGGEGSLFVEGSTQSESSDSGHSSSGDEDSDDEAEDGFCEQSVVDFLRGLQPFIVSCQTDAVQN